MVLWRQNKIDKPSAKLAKKKKHQIKLEMKRHYHWYHKNTKDHKSYMPTNPTGQHRKIDKLLETLNLPTLIRKKQKVEHSAFR